VAHELRARAALAARDTRSALADARRVENEDASWCRPLAALIRAQVALVRGDERSARGLLRAAELGFDAADMALHANSTRWRLGELTGGEEGAVLVARARTWFEAEGVIRPRSMVRMIAPVALGQERDGLERFA
jgi:hypothetical protein